MKMKPADVKGKTYIDFNFKSRFKFNTHVQNSKSKGIDKGKGRSFEKVINQNGPKNCLQLKKLKINIYVHM